MVVTTVIDSPYTMMRDGPQTLTGNDRFEGFIVDLVDIIAKNLRKKPLTVSLPVVSLFVINQQNLTIRSN